MIASCRDGHVTYVIGTLDGHLDSDISPLLTYVRPTLGKFKRFGNLFCLNQTEGM